MLFTTPFKDIFLVILYSNPKSEEILAVNFWSTPPDSGAVTITSPKRVLFKKAFQFLL